MAIINQSSAEMRGVKKKSGKIKMRIFVKDISERRDFDLNGYHYRQVRGNDEKHVYIFSQTNDEGKIVAYEVIKGKRRVNPDSQVAYTYPGNEDFGTYGYTCMSLEKAEIRYGEFMSSSTEDIMDDDPEVNEED